MIFAFAVFSAVYNVTLPLYLDEAYYWLWSKHLDFGYMDHPFMIALFIKASTMFGDSVFAIRMVSVACFSIASIFIYLSAKKAFDEKTALVAVLIFLLSPATSMGFTITSPDSPLAMFWAMGLYFSYRAIFEGKVIDYLLAGATAGLALSSKYTAILLLTFIGIFLLIRRRKDILTFKPWFAVFFAILFFAPTIYWNYTHDWLSFAFQFQHGTNESFSIDWGHFFEFFGGLFLVFSPVFFGYFLFLLTRAKEWFYDDKLLYFALSGIFVIVFFLYKGLFLKMQLNWVAPAFIGLSIFTARYLVITDAKKLLTIGLGVSLVLSLIVRFPSFVGLKGEQNIHSRLYGYKELSDEVQRVALPEDKIFADHLTLASILSFYLQGHGEARIPTSTRRSMFDEWQKGMDFKTQKGIYVSDTDRKAELAKIWQNTELIEIFQTASPAYKKRKFYIYRVSS